jgi:uncharacterized protein (TIGR02145 family)
MKILNVIVVVFMLGIVSLSHAQTVTIGTQEWMTKNLDVTTFRNGDTIPEAKTAREWRKAGYNKQPVWCYCEYNIEKGQYYGKLYNGYAVYDTRGLSPNGWHIPSSSEWKELNITLGEYAGKKMKSITGWINNKKKNRIGTNSVNFAGIPSGRCDDNGDYIEINSRAYFWSYEFLDNNNGRYLARYLNSDSRFLGSFMSTNKNEGFSVRCIKDK